MQQYESESPATGKGHGADLKTSFRGLTQRRPEYVPSPYLASVSDTTVEEQKAQKRKVIAWVHKKARQRHDRIPLPALRQRELEKIANHWWRGLLPDDHSGRVFVRIVANHLVGLKGDLRSRIERWCDRFAPWLDEDEFDEIVELASLRATQYSADSIANAIGLDITTRDALGINTIGAYDFSKADREERRRIKQRFRSALRRAADGATPRQLSKSQTRPWECDGVSRSTWYRQQKETRS